MPTILCRVSIPHWKPEKYFHIHIEWKRTKRFMYSKHQQQKLRPSVCLGKRINERTENTVFFECILKAIRCSPHQMKFSRRSTTSYMSLFWLCTNSAFLSLSLLFSSSSFSFHRFSCVPLHLISVLIQS